MDDALRGDVLLFLVGAPPHAARDPWFRKDASIDALIRARFGAAIDKALAGAYGDWCATAHGALARVLLLDQFTRNVFRDRRRSGQFLCRMALRVSSAARNVLRLGPQGPHHLWRIRDDLAHPHDIYHQ